MERKTKKELLEHYAKHEPKLFIRFDHFDLDHMTVGLRYELMQGSKVRVLIDPNTHKETVLTLLSKIVDWIKKEDDCFKEAEEELKRNKKIQSLSRLLLNEGYSITDIEDLLTNMKEATGEIVEGDGHFEGCPLCGKNDQHLNIHKNHWFYCDKHKTKWNVGYNLFSSWQFENESDWARNAETLKHYKEVEPALPGTKYGENSISDINPF